MHIQSRYPRIEDRADLTKSMVLHEVLRNKVFMLSPLSQSGTILDLTLTMIMLKSSVHCKDLIDTPKLTQDKTRSVYKQVVEFSISKKLRQDQRRKRNGSTVTRTL